MGGWLEQLLEQGSSPGPRLVTGGSDFSPVARDRVLLRQARESVADSATPDPSGPAVNPTEFSDLGDGAALLLARREFAADLSVAAWSPPVLAGGDRVAGYASDSTALVDGRGGRTLLSSLLPLRSPDGPDGVKSAVSTSLEARPDGFDVANPLTEVSIPTELGDGVSLDRVGVSVTPVGVESADGRRLGGDKVFYANAATDTDFVVAALPDGFETFAQIRSADSPDNQGLRFNLPAGARLEASPDGFGAVIKRGADVLARVSPASAVDASGNSVAVTESVSGNTVNIRVDARDSAVQYPIMLDPTITVDSQYWDRGTSTSSLAGWEYRSTNPNAFGSSTSGAWGRGLYSLVRAGAIGGIDVGEWRYTAPGDARIFAFGLGQAGKPATRLPNPANNLAPICTSQGLRVAGSSGGWEPGSTWQSAATSGNGPKTACQGASTNETPTFCAAVSCNVAGGSPGNAAINNQWAYGAGTRVRYNNDPFGVSEYDFIGAAYVSIADDKPPTVGVVGHSSTIPVEPVNRFTDTVTIGGNDTGTGIWHLTLKNRDKNGQDATIADQGYWCDGSRTVPCSASWNSSGTWATQQSLTYNTGGLAEGLNTLTVSATDRIGNETSAPREQSWTINVDRTAPAEPTLSGAPAALDNSKNATIRFTGEAGAKFTCSVDGGAAAPCTSPLALNNLADGNHSLAITQTDAAGNVGPVAKALWLLDTTPPSVTLGGSLSDGPESDPSDPEPRVTISASDPNVTGGATGVAAAELFVDGAINNDDRQQELQRIETSDCAGSACKFLAQTDDGGDFVMLDPSELSQGAHQLNLAVVDKAGNVAQVSWSHSFDSASGAGLSSSTGSVVDPCSAGTSASLDLPLMGSLPAPSASQSSAQSAVATMQTLDSAAAAGLEIDPNSAPAVALSAGGAAAVSTGEALPAKVTADPAAEIAIGTGASTTCIKTPQVEASSAMTKLAPDTALIKPGSQGAVVIQPTPDSVSLGYIVPAERSAAGLELKLDLHDGQTLVQDGDNVAVKAAPDPDSTDPAEVAVPEIQAAPADDSAIPTDALPSDASASETETPLTGFSPGEDDSYLKPVGAVTQGGQAVGLTLRVTGPDSVLVQAAELPQSLGAQKVLMNVAAYAASEESAKLRRFGRTHYPYLRMDSSERWTPHRFEEVLVKSPKWYIACWERSPRGAGRWQDLLHRNNSNQCWLGGLNTRDYLGNQKRTIYYAIKSRSASSPYWYVQYWMYYQYNDWYTDQLDHQSDWEAVAIKVKKKSLKVEGYIYGAHGEWVARTPPAVHSGHPVVYVTGLTHGNHSYKCKLDSNQACDSFRTHEGNWTGGGTNGGHKAGFDRWSRTERITQGSVYNTWKGNWGDSENDATPCWRFQFWEGCETWVASPGLQARNLFK